MLRRADHIRAMREMRLQRAEAEPHLFQPPASESEEPDQHTVKRTAPDKPVMRFMEVIDAPGQAADIRSAYAAKAEALRREKPVTDLKVAGNSALLSQDEGGQEKPTRNEHQPPHVVKRGPTIAPAGMGGIYSNAPRQPFRSRADVEIPQTANMAQQGLTMAGENRAARIRAAMNPERRQQLDAAAERLRDLLPPIEHSQAR